MYLPTLDTTLTVFVPNLSFARTPKDKLGTKTATMVSKVSKYITAKDRLGTKTVSVVSKVGKDIQISDRRNSRACIRLLKKRRRIISLKVVAMRMLSVMSA